MSDTVQQNFTTINHEARKKLGLSMNEYAVADLIYNLSNNPSSKIPGWCYAAKTTMGKYLDLSEKSVHVILNKLLTSKLIEKDPETKYLKVTSSWYHETVIKKPVESSVLKAEVTTATLKKVQPVAEESSVQVAEESSVNIDNKDKDIDNVNNKLLTQAKPEITLSGKSFGDPNINLVLAYFLQKMGIPKEDCPRRQSRQYWNLLLKESRTGIEGVKWLIDLASQDKWYRNTITSSKDLYYKRVKLVAAKRGQAPRVAVMEL